MFSFAFLVLLLAAPARADDSTLAELRARLVVPKDAASWTPEQTAVLKRLRRAEVMGAIQYLRDKTGTVLGSTVDLPTGKGYKRLLLTVHGYDNWLFILSQEARAYFEDKGAEAKFIFQLADLDKKRFFDDQGLLSDHGVESFRNIRRGKPVFWNNTDGRPMGTFRPPADGRPPPQPVVLAPPKPSAEPGMMPPGAAQAPSEAGRRLPADEAATREIDTLLRGGAIEVSADEAKVLASASGISQGELLEKNRLRAVPFEGKPRLFLKPDDPLSERLKLLRRGQR